MSDDPLHPALQRLLADDHTAQALELVGSGLSGADVSTLLLAAMAQRAADTSSADVLAQYRRDRFVAPGSIDPIVLARLHLAALEALSPQYAPVELAPLAPLGSHSVFAGVDQNRVVSTVRMTEVAADPTNQLALEAAVRRRARLDEDPKSADVVQLCGVKRVSRAQVFDGPTSFSHFSLLGVVAAGRTLGWHRFEVEALATMLEALAAFLATMTSRSVHIGLTDFDGGYQDLISEVESRVAGPLISCSAHDDREAGRGYYPSLCFKLWVDADDGPVEVGDGGFVGWTSALLQSKKERLLIGGIGLDRLALM